MDVRDSARNITLGIVASVITVPILGGLAWWLKVRPWQLSLILSLMVLFIILLVLFTIYHQATLKQLILLVESSQREVRADVETGIAQIEDNVNRLRNEFADFDWTFHAEEHRSAIYGKVVTLINDSAVARFDVMTIFRALEQSESLDPRSSQALSEYYGAIEKALLERGNYKYRRAVIIRHDSGGQAGFSDDDQTRHLLRSIKTRRPEFVEHYRRVKFRTVYKYPNDAQIELFRDDARLFDVAFVLTADRNNSALALSIELGISTTLSMGTDDPVQVRTPRQALAAITIRNPRLELQSAFADAFQVLLSGRVVRRIDPRIIQEEWDVP